MDWIKLAVLLLQLANKIVNWAHDQGKIDEGRQQAIGEMALAIAARVRSRDQIMEQVNAMSDSDVDDGLRGLEPR
jgi:hypothetical protein